MYVCISDADPAGPAPAYELDAIKVEWHSTEGREPEVMSLEEWGLRTTLEAARSKKAPWRPYFRTREDFEFADILRKYGMKAKDQDALIKIKMKGGGGQSGITFSGYDEVASAWEQAKLDLVSVCI